MQQSATTSSLLVYESVFKTIFYFKIVISVSLVLLLESELKSRQDICILVEADREQLRQKVQQRLVVNSVGTLYRFLRF